MNDDSDERELMMVIRVACACTSTYIMLVISCSLFTCVLYRREQRAAMAE